MASKPPRPRSRPPRAPATAAPADRRAGDVAPSGSALALAKRALGLDLPVSPTHSPKTRPIAELRAELAQSDASRADLITRLARAEKSVAALRDVGMALGSTLDLDQLLELILHRITDLSEADRATLYLLDERRKKLVSRIVIGDETRSIELDVGDGIAGSVAKTGRAIRVKDAYKDKRFRREWDELTGYRTRSILAVPMKNHVGRTIGVIQVLNKHPELGAKPGTFGEFSEGDEELLAALATQAAVSIDNSRLFLSVIHKNMQLVETKEQLEHRVADLKLLFDLESSMGRAGTVEELAWAVLKEAGRACEARAAALLVDEEDAGAWIYLLQVRDGRATRPSDVVRLPHRRGGDGALGHALQAGEAVSLSARTPGTGRGGAPTLEGEVSGRLAEKFGHPIESVIAVPLEGEDAATLGAMALYNSKKGAFTQDDRSLLRLVSANASTAVRLFRSRVERERSERLTAIGRLLSGVMHDVRTPLTVISGYVQLMAGADDADTRAEYARLVLKQFDVITAMQREVLEFARGERNILLRKVFLAKFFGDIEQQLAQQVAGSGVRVVVDIADRGTARFDEAKMTRVVHNLARNAIEAMAETGGTLTIRCAREQGELVMSFADTGKGIPKEIEGRLFQSFVTAGKAQGTGLGLAIVKKIVDEHGGTISVESSERGATFTVRLPVDPQPERSQSRARVVS